MLDGAKCNIDRQNRMTDLSLMKKKSYSKILVGILSVSILLLVLVSIFIEPWVKKKIESVLSELNIGYIVTIEEVNVSILKSRVEIKSIDIISNQKVGNSSDINAHISTISFEGISLRKLIFNEELDVDELDVSESKIQGKILLSSGKKIAVISPANIRIDLIRLNKIDLAIEHISTAQNYAVNEGSVQIYALQLYENDTLSFKAIEKSDFKAREIQSTSADSLYTFKISTISFLDSSNTLAIDSLFILPNYDDYDFTSRHAFETDRIQISFGNIKFHDADIAAYLRSNALLSSYVEIGKMDMNIFRDKRKTLEHKKKIEFQEVLYHFPGMIHIDSVGITTGNIVYREHAEKANEPGKISFNKVTAQLYNISNEQIYETKTEFMTLKSQALLMGKGKIAVHISAKIFDPLNTFSVQGTLSAMEGKELNPLLEKNAFLHVTSGKIEHMVFNFTATSKESKGDLVILYHGLDISVKNKRVDQKSSLVEKVISLFANRKILDSNPLPRKEVRTGEIYFKRDPERFFFSYCSKSILSGLKTSIVKSSAKNK